MTNKLKLIPTALLSAIAATGYAQESVEYNCSKLTDKSPDIAKIKCNQTNKNIVQLSPISITANRMEGSVAKYAGQISILEGEDLKTHENIINNLKQVPGIETGGDYGRMIGTQYKIRGFGYQDGDRVIIAQDGIKRAPSLFSNHISSFRVDPKLLQRVEVIKGGSSILHGSGAIGGIISMETKNANDFIREGKDVGFTIGARKDTNNSQSAYMAFAVDSEKSPFNLLVYKSLGDYGKIKLADGGNYSRSYADYVSEVPNDERIDTNYVKLGLDINDEQSLSLSYYDYSEKISNAAWQNLWHLSSRMQIDGQLDQSDIVFNYTYEPSDNPWINLEANAYKSEASYFRAWVHPRFGIGTYENADSRWGVNIKNQSSFDIKEIENNLVFGIDYENRSEDAAMNRYGTMADFGSFPNRYKDLGLYFQNTSSYKNLEVTLGGRYDHFEREIEKPNQSGYSESHFSPKISASYEIVDGINLLAGYSEVFRAPTPNESGMSGPMNPHYWYIPNPDLGPELSKEFEVGISIDKTDVFAQDDALYAKGTYYSSNVENMIALQSRGPINPGDPDFDSSAPNRQYVQNTNIGAAERRGFEIEGKYRLNGLEIGAGFEHSDFYRLSRGEFNIRPSADKAFLNVGYSHKDTGLSAGAKVTHWFKPDRDSYETTRRYRDPSGAIRTYNTKFVDRDYTIVDVNVGWDPVRTGVSFLDNDFKMNVGINNVFDSKRLSPASVIDSTSVGRGRNYFFNFEKMF